jgi:15-cis-phytoene synthase
MLQAQYWEIHLLDMAQAALESSISVPHPIGADRQTLDQNALRDGYQHCERITRENSRTFYLASGLLPADKRRATRALYAFCRVSDDLIDRPVGDPAAALEAWRQQVIYNPSLNPSQTSQSAVALAWADARRRYAIPRGYLEQLIDGLALDMQQVRYDTFADLARYCYGAACTVGLMSMHITGYSSREAIPYAIRLGVALQLTNILRDVGEDWRAGRLYLPREELESFGLGESDIVAGVETGVYDGRWRALMRFQIARARRLYAEALPGVALLHPDGRFAITAAGELYRAILDQIETNDYDVFTRRASVGAWGKLRRLPEIWLHAKNAL